MNNSYFYEIFDWFIESSDETRFHFCGGYPSQYTYHKGKAFVTTVNDQDEIRLNEYDINALKKKLGKAINLFCKRRGVEKDKPFEELLEHEESELLRDDLYAIFYEAD